MRLVVLIKGSISQWKPSELKSILVCIADHQEMLVILMADKKPGSP